MVRRIASVTEETYLCDEVYVVVDVNQENRACWMYLKLFLLQSYDFLVKPPNNMREYLGKPTFFSIFA
jgi:hypothetical protein